MKINYITEHRGEETSHRLDGDPKPCCHGMSHGFGSLVVLTTPADPAGDGDDVDWYYGDPTLSLIDPNRQGFAAYRRYCFITHCPWCGEKVELTQTGERTFTKKTRSASYQTTEWV